MIDRRRLLSSAVAAPLAARSSTRAQEPLRILGWSTLVDEGVINRFREMSGVDIIVDPVPALDEIVIRLRGGGASRYSLVMSHHGLAQTLRDHGLIQPIDEARIPAIGGVDPHFQLSESITHNGARYAIPVLFTTCPCIYNADLLPEPPGAWIDLDSDEFTGRIGMLDEGLAHFYLGGRAVGSQTAPALSPNDMDATIDLLTNLKENRVSHFTPFDRDLSAMLRSGKAVISTTGWEGMTLFEEATGANLQVAHLAPGDFSVVQTLAVTSQAPMVDAAHQFIEFMLQPDEQAALSNRTKRGIVNPGAVDQIDERIRGFTDYANLDAVFTQSPMLDFPPFAESADGTATYLDWIVAWEKIRLTTSNAAP